MYDGKIGRWLSTDPAGQYASPYEGMGNNPVMGSDPTGGYDNFWSAWVASWFGIKGDVLQDHSGGINDKQYFYSTKEEYKGGEGGVYYVNHYGAGSAMNQQVNHVMAEVARQEYIRHKKPDIGAVESPIIDPIDFAGGIVSGGLKGLMSAGVREAEVLTVEELAVHGNSLKSLKPTWGYKLYSEDGTFLKNGITSKLVPEARYTRAFMSDKYMEPILFPNRAAAYGWEFQQNQIMRGPLNLNMH